MPRIAIIGAGITGVTSAYALSKQGYDVTVYDRQRYPAMETSYANGGQLSACNAEVWNSVSTIMKGLRWLGRHDAPLLLNPRFSWHKYSWLAQFIGQIRHYRQNTIDTTRLAIEARQHLYTMAEEEGIDFDLERRGILHIYHDAASFETARRANALLQEGGLERYAVTPAEARNIEPALQTTCHGGFYTPSDATGDIHKFTSGLARACARRGVRFVQDADIRDIIPERGGYLLDLADADARSRRQRVRRRRRHLRRRRQPAVRQAPGRHGQHLPRQGLLHQRAPGRRGQPRFGAQREPARRKPPRSSPAGWATGSASPARPSSTASTWTSAPNAAAGGLDPQSTSGIRTSRGAVVRVAPDDAEHDAQVGPGKRPGVFYNTGHGHLGWTLVGRDRAIAGRQRADVHGRGLTPARRSMRRDRLPRALPGGLLRHAVRGARAGVLSRSVRPSSRG